MKKSLSIGEYQEASLDAPRKLVEHPVSPEIMDLIHSNLEVGNINVEPLLFEEKDVLKTNHPLSRMLRFILMFKKITRSLFSRLHSNFGIDQQWDTAKINHNRNNILRTISGTSTNVTWPTFEKISTYMLKLELVDMELTFKNQDGKIEKYSLSQVEEWFNSRNVS
jgi:hypothetical protein